MQTVLGSVCVSEQESLRAELEGINTILACNKPAALDTSVLRSQSFLNHGVCSL